MTTREEIIEEDIRKLNDTIGELQTERQSAKTDERKISLGAQITAKTELLTIIEKQRLFFLEQQSKFTTHFHCPFPIFSM